MFKNYSKKTQNIDQASSNDLPTQTQTTKKGRTLKPALAEALVEIVLTLIVMGLGGLIIGLFGANIDWSEIDGDMLFLIGASPIIIFGIVYLFINNICKKK